jgi:hypothetical protein
VGGQSRAGHAADRKIETTDNAVIVRWRDPNALPADIILFASLGGPATADEQWFYHYTSGFRAGWFIDQPDVESTGGVVVGGEFVPVPFRPGTVFGLDVRTARNGISTSGALGDAATSIPTIRIGSPEGPESTPTPDRAFAVWDSDRDGVVRDAGGAGGA